MQPEQQNQTSSPGSNIPDYLGMKPVINPVDNKRKNRKKTAITILFFVLFTILTFGGVVLYLLLQQDTLQEKFYQALDNSMQVSYVKRDIDLTKEGGSIVTTISTDSSNPKKTKSDVLITATSTGKASSSVQTIVPSDDQYLFSIKSTVPESSINDLEKNQWYRTSFNAAERKDVGYLIDSTWSPLLLNSVQGLILVGNFTNDQRSQLLDYIKSNDVYNVSDLQIQKGSSTKLTGYKIQLDIDKINALNAQAAKLLGLAQLFTVQKPYPEYQEVIFWVNETTGKFSKITYNSSENKDSTGTKQTTTLTYPDQLSITIPSGVKELPS